MTKNIKYFALGSFSAIVMFIEIIGAKLLTPILGGSQTVWISQILITLLSLAIGGAISSFIKKRKMETICISIYLSAIYLLLVLFNLNFILDFTKHLDFAQASLILSSTLYVFPLVSLGMAFPTLYASLEKDHSQNLGIIYFIGTIGSTIGTVFTYFAIYFGNNSSLLMVCSLIQIFITLILGYDKNKSSKKMEMSALIPLFILGFFYYKNLNNIEPTESQIIFYKNSHFGEVSIIKQKDETLIISDGITQNGFNSHNQSIHLFSYAIERLPFYYQPNIHSTLILGFGVGASVEFLKKKNNTIDAVEINSVMKDAAEQLFPENLKGVNLHITDARNYVRSSKLLYDSILLDCFLVDNVPKYLLTIESFHEIKSILNERGILTINSFGRTDVPDMLTLSIYKTLKSTFKYVNIFSINEWNVFYVASDSQLIEGDLDKFNIPLDIVEKIKRLVSNPIQLNNDGILLKDNESKIDLLDNIPRESYRKKHRISLNK